MNVVESGLAGRTVEPAKASSGIQILRCLRLALHFVWIGLGAALIYPCVAPSTRRRLKQRWSHRILDILGVRLDAGPIDAPPGCLVVANHISWLDIFAIHSVRPSSFIAKAEIRGWPFVGWLAERNDTVFLRRGSRGHARDINREIDARLAAGRDVAVFPEGMTTDGTVLLGFHAALLQPAIETGRPILPLALSYHEDRADDNDDRLSTAASFAGDITLMRCFRSILACRHLRVRIVAGTPLPSAGRRRRELCEAAHAAIAATLITRPGFRPANTAPDKAPGLQDEPQ